MGEEEEEEEEEGDEDAAAKSHTQLQQKKKKEEEKKKKKGEEEERGEEEKELRRRRRRRKEEKKNKKGGEEEERKRRRRRRRRRRRKEGKKKKKGREEEERRRRRRRRKKKKKGGEEEEEEAFAVFRSEVAPAVRVSAWPRAPSSHRRVQTSHHIRACRGDSVLLPHLKQRVDRVHFLRCPPARGRIREREGGRRGAQTSPRQAPDKPHTARAGLRCCCRSDRTEERTLREIVISDQWNLSGRPGAESGSSPCCGSCCGIKVQLWSGGCCCCCSAAVRAARYVKDLAAGILKLDKDTTPEGDEKRRMEEEEEEEEMCLEQPPGGDAESSINKQFYINHSFHKNRKQKRYLPLVAGCRATASPRCFLWTF
ncbi:uncharacterized protein V6R79_003603 [Siganus canaliculatus]